VGAVRSRSAKWLRCIAALPACALFIAAPARAQQTPNPFGCPGQAQAILDGLGTTDMRQERDKRIDAPAPPGETASELALRMCVEGEIMARLGDERATSYFRRAIEADGTDGAYELWFGQYLGGNRGSRYPLLEDSERHLNRALEKVRQRKTNGHATEWDPITEDWAERRLVDLYQADGLPVLPWKGFPYRFNGEQAPGLFLTAEARASADTNDFLDVSDVRNFTSQMLFSESVERLDRPLTLAEKQALAIAPLRYSYFLRARLRQNILGALDFSYRDLQIVKGQVIRYDQPTVFGDAKVEEIGATYKRGFDLYPLFDATVEASYRRVERLGIVEFFPTEWEHIGLTEIKPSISRFIGPDVLTAGVNYVNMDISSIVGGELDQRKRARSIRAAYFDYAVYRPLLLPSTSDALRIHRKATRGWHLFGGVAYDDEVFGTRLVQKRDYYGGTSLLGMGRWDLTLQGTLYQGGVTDNIGYNLTSLSNAQWRTTLVPLFRIIDGDAMPTMPGSEAPVFLNLVFPLRQDVATQGPKDYDNFRAGVELWTRVVAPDLRGTSFLISGGYAFQDFYNIGKQLNTARIDVGMGW
jgi:hypothetical protein